MRPGRRAPALAIALALGPVAAAAQEEALRLPSGLEARVLEVITERSAGIGLVYRFRYVAEGFAPDAERLDAITADLAWLCETHALPRVSAMEPRPRQLVISLADRASEFGVLDPAVTQVFEAFRPAGDRCDWDMF
jgi:hypothetical protein